MNQSSRILFWIICCLSILFLIPHLFVPIINFGQLTKQTFVAEMIRGFLENDRIGIWFANRHFPELTHPGVIPWAEEFPIFHWIIVGLVRFLEFFSFHANPIILAKFINLFALISITFGFYRIGNLLYSRSKTISPWIFAGVAILYPAFRLYSIEVMPDLWMTAFCVWAIERHLNEKHFSAAFFLLMATLFKYYAAFTALGFFLDHAYRWIKYKKHQEAIRAVLVGFAVLPCLLFIAYFIHTGIPNPITEYRANDGHGHFSSLQRIFQPYLWSRVLLWIFVKNGTLLGGALAIYGFIVNRKTLPPLFHALIFSWSLFPLVFLESFIVHDYYGLQASIGVALFAAMGFLKLYESKRIKWFYSLFAIFAVWGISQTRSMSKTNTDFNSIMNDYPDLVSKLEKKPTWGLMISGISKPLIPHLTRLNSWIAGFNDVGSPILESKLMDPRIEIVMVHGFLSQGSEIEKTARAIDSSGNFELFVERNYSQSRFLAYRKITRTLPPTQ
jgi:hypothetical protein